MLLWWDLPLVSVLELLQSSVLWQEETRRLTTFIIPYVIGISEKLYPRQHQIRVQSSSAPSRLHVNAELIGFTLVYVLTSTGSSVLHIWSVPPLVVQNPPEQIWRPSILVDAQRSNSAKFSTEQTGNHTPKQSFSNEKPSVLTPAQKKRKTNKRSSSNPSIGKTLCCCVFN